MAISSLGVGSGLDLNSIISSLMKVEQQPLVALQTKEASYQSRISALGSLKGVLSSLQTAAGSLIPSSGQTASEKYSTFKAKSGDESIATATVSGGTAAANYSLSNITLASAEQARKSETALGIPLSGDGTLSIQVGGSAAVNVNVVAGSSPSDIAKAINSADSKVTASVINDGTTKHLIISAKETGAGNTISITGSTGWEGFNYRATSAPGDSNAWIQQQSAASASVDINGLTITSTKNTISDAISGVTINLLKASASGTTLNITQDTTTSITVALNSFITAYNSASSTMKSLGAYNEATKVAGALQGDATLRSAQNQVSRLLTNAVGSGDFRVLSDIGVSLQKDGTLKLDTAKLNKALESNFSGVSSLVSAVGTSFKSNLDTLIDSGGIITSATDNANRMIKDLQKRQDALEARLERVQTRYTKQFSALDTLLAGMNQTSSALSQMLANLPGSSSNDN
jgi:flagellar hook-associated protein 2